MNQTPVLVTGAAGFVGRHLLQAIIHYQKSVRPLALVQNQESWNRYDWVKKLTGVETIKGSVIKPETWTNDLRLQGLKGIYHLAAIVRHNRDNPSDMYETNIEGLLNIIRLAHTHQCRVIFVSTSGTVGCFKSPNQWADENSPYCEKEVASWPYYDSKIKAEKKARALADQLEVELTIIRPPVLLGPGDHRFRATGHILRLLRGKLPFLLKGGIHFVDIRDAALACITAMNKPNARPIYHLCGTATNIDHFFGMVQEVSGAIPPRLHLPAGLARLVAKMTKRIDTLIPGRHSTLLPDPVVFEMASKYWGVRSLYAKEELGFVSRDPLETLSDTVQWLRANHEDLKEASPLKVAESLK